MKVQISMKMVIVGEIRKPSGFVSFNQDSVIRKMTGFDASDFFKQNKQ